MFDVSCDPCDEDENESKPLLSDNLTPRSRRKFDSVRNLLEKARAKLSLKTLFVCYLCTDNIIGLKDKILFMGGVQQLIILKLIY